MEYSEKLIKLVNSKQSLRYYTDEEKDLLIAETSFLDKAETLSYRKAVVLNNFHSTPVCKICGKKVSLKSNAINGIRQFRQCCCKKCANEYHKTEEFKEKSKQTCLEKYGVDNYSKTEEFKEKMLDENNQFYFQTEEFKEKSKQTCLEKYGTEWYSTTQKKEPKPKKERTKKEPKPKKERTKKEPKPKADRQQRLEKYRQTCLERYGVDNYFKSDKFKNSLPKSLEKYRQTCLERYGTENYNQSQKFIDNIPKMTEKQKQTCLERYGKEYYQQTKEFSKRLKQTCLERYGTENYNKSNEFKKKIEENFKALLDKNDLLEHYDYIRYISKRIHLLKCKKCGKEFQANSAGFYQNRTQDKQELCPFCNPLYKTYSILEKELLDFIKEIYSGEIIENDRTNLNGLELDIYLPEKQLAIEFNGLYWHSSAQKDKNYHKMKSDMCKEKGIHLIHIFEDDWKYKKEIIKSILVNFIDNSSNNKIFARKCKIRSVSLKECNEFLETNHLLGSLLLHNITYGLYYNNELISLMTFRLVSKETNQYELSRYAIKCNYKVIGGAEKLFNHFITEHNFSSIITYNDNSIFKGNVYPKLGFKYVRTNSPNYTYFSTSTKQRFPKQFIRKLKVGYKIEKEIELGYYRIYNAGNDVYLYEKFADNNEN